MVAKRKFVEGGAASSKGASGLVARLRKVGSTCAPEKIWSVIQAALGTEMGEQKLNLRAALEVASNQAPTAYKSRVSIGSQPKASTNKAAAAKSTAKAATKSTAKGTKAATAKSLPVRKAAVKTEQDMVDLSQFDDLYDLINAWMRTKGVVKREPAAATTRENAAKNEPKVKREPMISRELAKEIRKLGTIDLTEGEPQKRSASGSASAASKVRSHSPARTTQATAAKGSSARSPATNQRMRRSLSKAKLAVQRTLGKAVSKSKEAEKAPRQKIPQALAKSKEVATLPRQKAAVKSKEADKEHREKMPQGLKSLNKLASKCDPHKLWTILQAAAHENKPSASIGAALRAARETASEAGHKPRQA
mmetsp:Transcript_93839/g.249118  ORF Transcript_93839/g.249118 Transcript_93839/m.249118 type:complete len:364 (-) Transcript_93839:135-1226(-)